ncbi:GntR family transcriptional regulator [Mangrovibacterium marinum]|uniref:DNA-binding transcriptional regulator YhcF (GntR family) n=1 Tax=Mangrovibacterium marinum TaxID=1639118 RepID=A0A2T5BZY6_9BACT|nr:substrate-binding domain-containing protein [Mangrovibacterium marinum]PTN07883.1 DNA-binding transcriptional regulator YhcF (GntR family) [Mangrovibacterium marinum]
MSKFKFQIDPLSNQLKFQQLVDAVTDAISRNLLQVGDILPSVNQLVKESSLSRDTVFKAYAELKNRGIVESVPNKGYFIAKATTKVFLFLDTFKAYKEVLYGSFLDNLPDNFTVDLHFHHYNIEIFEKIITESIGKYSKYIVMNFDHERVPEIIQQIPPAKLLSIDWQVHTIAEASSIYQDFGPSLYQALQTEVPLIKKYQRFIYLYPEFTYHPPESLEYFERFCKDNNIRFEIFKSSRQMTVEQGDLYLLVSDRTLARFLDQCATKNLTIGQDVGVISYNETPMKKYVKDGISVISTDFESMGKKAAEFVKSGESIHLQIPTHLTIRASV